MSPPMQSGIWNYFKPNEHNQDKADCKICNKSYSRKGRTTTSLKNHLKSMHPEEFGFLGILSEEKQLQKIKTDPGKIQETKKQLPFVELTTERKWDTNNFNSKKIDKLVGEMLTLENLPFNFVEGLGIRRLIQELAPQYNLRAHNIFTDFVCTELYGKVTQKVKKLIENFDYFSFTSDIWTDPSLNASLLSLTCHGIAENFDRSSIILKCETFNGHYTGDIICEKFYTMLSEWNIRKEQVHCLIQDGGSNMKRAVRLAALNGIDCTVHKMQLAIRSCLDSQENIKVVKQKCEKILTHFSHSTIGEKQLQAIQDRLNQPHLKVFQACITRFNSTFYMFEYFFKVKDSLNLYFNDSDIKPILPEEWKIIESCIELLKPFEEATQELCRSHALISSVIPILQMLKKKVNDRLSRSQDFDPIRNAVMTLKSELSTKFSNLVENNLYTIATYLDPRYKHKFFTPMIEEKIKEDILMMRLRNTENYSSFNSEGAKRMRMTDSLEKDREQLGPGTAGLIRKPCLKNNLPMMLDSSSEDESQETPENGSAEAVLEKELLTYHLKKRINVDENPLKWWCIHREEFKLLSPIARRFLSTPPTSILSEELFSNAGFYEPNRLDHEKMAILLIIKFNAQMLKL